MECLLKKIYCRVNDVVNFIIRCILILKYNRKVTHQSDTITLFSLGGIGDYIIKSPIFEGYRNLYKEKYIVLICRNSISSLTRKNPYIDSTIHIDLKKYKYDLIYRVILFSQIYTINSDTFINLDYSTDQEMVARHFIRVINFKKKIAYKCLDKDANRDYRYYNIIIENNKEWLFEIKRNIEMLRKLGGMVKTDRTKIWGIPTENVWFDEMINNYQIPFFVLAVGSLLEIKIFPPKKNAYVVNKLLERDLICVIVGGSDEHMYSEAIINEVNNKKNILNLVGRTGLLDLCYIVSKSLFVLSNDSSTAHIAVALDKRVYVILGGGHFGRFFPYPNGSDRVIIDKRNIECFKCYWNCKYKDFRCISNIDEEDVLEKIMKEM